MFIFLITPLLSYVLLVWTLYFTRVWWLALAYLVYFYVE